MFLKPSTKLNFDPILDNFNVIREEYIKATTSNTFLDYTSVETGTNDLISNPVYGKSNWQVHPLWYGYKPWKGLENSPTMELLQKLNVTPLLSTFSKLRPNCELPWHEDHDERSVNRDETTVIKYHLTLYTPGEGDSILEFESERRILKEGDLNVFDESITHRAINNSDQERGVLIVSFLKPDVF